MKRANEVHFMPLFSIMVKKVNKLREEPLKKKNYFNQSLKNKNKRNISHKFHQN